MDLYYSLFWFFFMITVFITAVTTVVIMHIAASERVMIIPDIGVMESLLIF